MRLEKDVLAAWLLLLLDGGATYGYELRRELAAHRVGIDPSAVYRTLRRLERDACVRSSWVAPVDGPRRRCYELSQRGRVRLDETVPMVAAARDLHDAFLRAHELARIAPSA